MDAVVVVSHLRWDWVWQRPQHLISRIARGRDVWFVEEPLAGGVAEPRMVSEQCGPVRRAWLEVPGEEHPRGFEPRWAALNAALLPELIGPSKVDLAWLYTPMGLEIAEAVSPTTLVFDVMDDLTAFRDAPRGLLLRHAQALRRADLVFTGGRSLQRSALAHRPTATHQFASGVDASHWESARRHRRHRKRPVAGYVGVVDERLDLDLVAELARQLPDWDVEIVGPVAKIDPAELPSAPNLSWSGKRTYDELPEVLAGFDVALMPFALNDATRSISPTKTLEYLAAGLPVVSTRVPDVVAEHATVVDLRDDAEGFAAGCREVLGHDLSTRDRKLRPLLAERDWDVIARRMLDLIEQHDRVGSSSVEEGCLVPDEAEAIEVDEVIA